MILKEGDRVIGIYDYNFDQLGVVETRGGFMNTYYYVVVWDCGISSFETPKSIKLYTGDDK